ERIRQVSPRRRAVGLIGKIELGRLAPETFEIVVAPSLLTENVHHKAAEIEQRPFSGAMSLAMLRRATQILVELPLDLGADSLHLGRAEAGAYHEIIREGARSPQIEHGDARGFLFLSSFDSESYAWWQVFKFQR